MGTNLILLIIDTANGWCWPSALWYAKVQCGKARFFHVKEGIQQDLNAYSLPTCPQHHQVQLLHLSRFSMNLNKSKSL